MSETPNCVVARTGCKMRRDPDIWSARIREFNGNLRIFEARITESIAHDSGLRTIRAQAVSGWGTALKVLRKVSGCTIEVDKCIQ